MYKRKRCRYNEPYVCSKKRRRMKEESDIEDEEDKDKGGIGIGVFKNLMNRKIDCIGNHIWFNDDITNSSVSQLIKIISGRNFVFEQKRIEMFYCKIEPTPIYLHINSYGGELQEGMAAVDAIRNSKIPIYTIIEGEAASAATFLSVAGKKRFMTENSVLLIHQLSGGAWGKMEELEDEHENNKFFMEKIYSLYSKYTKISRRRLEKIMKRDIWWGFDKAIKYGFVDAIYTGEEEAEKISAPDARVDSGDEGDD